MKTGKGQNFTESLSAGFSKYFGDKEGTKCFLSPASIVMLGDHTQYNDGIMLTAAVNSYIGFCIRKSDEKFKIVIDNQLYEAEELSELKFDSSLYILKGLANIVSRLVRENISVPPFECFININSAMVFGIGNAASMNVGFLYAVNSALKINFTQQQIVDFTIESDRELYGNIVSKPLYHSVLGQRSNTMLYFDTRTDSKKFLPFDEKYSLVVCNSHIPKENFSEKCKERIQECEVGVKGLRLYIWGIKNLRDVEEKFLERHIHMLPKRLYMRCLYNVHERKIVEEVYKALKAGDVELFGKKMFETQKNLSEEYEISSDTMDQLVKHALDSKLSLGSKMISCSYHDSTVNFVEKKNVKKFKDYILSRYTPLNGSKLEVESFSLSEGIKELKLQEKHAVH